MIVVVSTRAKYRWTSASELSMKNIMIFLVLTVVFVMHGSGFAAGAEHDWNLGATGLRGWIRCDKMVTSDAREITITRVEAGSPADGVFAVAD